MASPRTLLLAADPVAAWRARAGDEAASATAFDRVFVASPAAVAAFGLRGPTTTLERWARRPPRVVVPPLERRRALVDAVAEVWGDDLAAGDAGGHAAVAGDAVRELLRAPLDLDGPAPAAWGPRARRWWRVAGAYRRRLRARGGGDPAEMQRLAAVALRDGGVAPVRVAVLGAVTFEPDEIELVDAAAGPGSLVVLPHAPPWTDAAAAAVDAFVARGWHLARDERVGAPVRRTAVAWPTLEDEARGAVAEVKRLRAAGIPAEQVVLAAREPAHYADALLAAGAEVGVAVRVDRWVPLATTAAAAPLVAWLDAVVRDAAFEPTLAWLAHPRVATIGADDVAEVRRWRPSNAGAWQRALARRSGGHAAASAVAGVGAVAGDAPATTLGVPEGASAGDAVAAALAWGRAAPPAAWRTRLASAWGDLPRVDGATPLDPLADPAVRGAWVAALAGFDDLPHDARGRVAARAVLAALRDALRHTNVRWTHADAPPSDPTVDEPAPLEDGDAVWLRPLEALGDARVAHVLLLGAVDGVMPTAIADDPVLGFRERAALADLGVPVAGPGQAGRREALRFWAALQAATERAWIGVPAQTGADARLPSPYLERLGLVPASPAPAPPASPQAFRARALRAGAVADAVDPVLARARRAYAQAVGRETGSAWGGDDGYVRVAVDPDAFVWSATQLQHVGTCRFRWWVERVWGVAAPEEGPEALTPLLEGRLYHRALDGALKAAVGLGGAAARAAARAALDEAFVVAEAAEHLASLVPHWSRLREEHLDHLRRLVDAPDFLPDGHEVLATERAFDGVWHGWKVRGRVDRVDRTPDGVEVLDYKLGGRRPLGARDAELAPRIDLQLPLYRDVAAPAVAPGEPVADAAYVSLRTRRRVPAAAPAPGMIEDLFARLRASLAAGFFPPEPGDDVCRYCDLAAVCRKGPHLDLKPLPLQVPESSP